MRDDVRIISTDELQRRLDRDNGLHLLNVQTGRSFTGELIPGSRRLPVDRIGAQPFAVSKDAEIVTYCAGSQCSESAEAARNPDSPRLHERRHLEGGTRGLEDGWQRDHRTASAAGSLMSGSSPG
jgi:rhodanese-related sulfurtransferase